MNKKIIQLVLFLLGFGLFMFSRRSEIIPTFGCAIIIAPIFILRFLRTQERYALGLTFLGFLLSLNIALFGLFNIDDGFGTLAVNFIRSSLLSVLFFIPYLLDRLIYRRIRLPGAVKTLVFPILVTAILFLSSLEGPFDGDVAKDIYSQGPLFLQQTASLFGLWGFVFMYSWIASFVNYLWEHRFQCRAVAPACAAIIGAFLILSGFGLIRMASYPDQNTATVKVAAAVLTPRDGKPVLMMDIFNAKQVSPFENVMRRIEDMTKQASGKAAKIISFQEYAIVVTDEDRDILLKELQRIARDNRIYLNLAYSYFSKNEKGRNMNVLISPEGVVLIHYAKRFLLGFGESGETLVFRKGPEVIQTAATPYGVIGVATCRDMSFPSYIRQAGQKNVDLMLGPSYDFPKSETHSYYLRAIENGFSLVRATYNGISYAMDYHGRILAIMDSEKSKDGMMVADIPIKGVRTFYSRWGDWFGWACVFSALLCAIYAFVRKPS